jgi:hypothetical protein
MRASRFGIGAISLCLAAMLAGAAAPAWGAPVVVTGKDNGKTLTLPVGQELVVDLHLGAGQYVLAPDFDASILALVGQTIQSTSGSQGSSSRVVYTFVVQHSGQTDVVITTQGSEKKGSQPEPLLKVKIVATGGGLGV